MHAWPSLVIIAATPQLSTSLPNPTLPTRSPHPTPKLPLRPIEMRIQHRTSPTQHALHREGQQAVQLLDRARVFRPQVAARRRLGDAGVVRRRREGDVHLFVRHLGRGAVRVHEEEGAARGVPACFGCGVVSL